MEESCLDCQRIVDKIPDIYQKSTREECSQVNFPKYT